MSITLIYMYTYIHTYVYILKNHSPALNLVRIIYSLSRAKCYETHKFLKIPKAYVLSFKAKMEQRFVYVSIMADHFFWFLKFAIIFFFKTFTQKVRVLYIYILLGLRVWFFLLISTSAHQTQNVRKIRYFLAEFFLENQFNLEFCGFS